MKFFASVFYCLFLLLSVPAVTIAKAPIHPSDYKDWEGVWQAIREKADANDPYCQALAGQAMIQGNMLAWDPEKGLSLVRQAADRDDPLGLYFLAELNQEGLRLASGNGVQRDTARAQTLFKRALPGMEKMAQKKDPFAQYHLGRCFAGGVFCDRDEKKAIQWGQAAHENGNRQATSWLGYAFYMGTQGLEKNPEKGAGLWQEAADQKYGGACFNMGVIYKSGLAGYKADLLKALGYYREAARLHWADGRYYEGRNYISDQDLKIKSIERAAREGSAKAMTYMANALFYGEPPLSKDTEKALEWAVRSVLRNPDQYDAYDTLGVLYTLAVVEAEADRVRGGAYFGLAILAEPDHKLKGISATAAGLTFPMMVCLENKDLSDPYLTHVLLSLPPRAHGVDHAMRRVKQAYEADMETIGNDLFDETAAEFGNLLFFEQIWFEAAEGRLPFELHSRLMEMLKPRMQHLPEFWFQYAQGAYEAGQPSLALAAADRMKAVLDRTESGQGILSNACDLIKAASLAELGKKDEAYALLYGSGIKDNPHKLMKEAMAVYIKNRLTPLLKDKKKLAFVTDIDQDWFNGADSPRWQRTSRTYHHPVSGKLIPVGPAPVQKDNTPPAPDNDKPGPSKGPAKKEAETGKDDNALPKIRIID